MRFPDEIGTAHSKLYDADDCVIRVSIRSVLKVIIKSLSVNPCTVNEM